jgi:UDP-N-acetylmuramoyl-L-alanyl-D-glutamate--2,6-diaminopimelate ligase
MIVDYAHTPDALLKVLETLKTIAKDRRGEIYLVFGCGGDRDEGKRSIMGKIAEENAHHVIITNDNPRSENPQKII